MEDIFVESKMIESPIIHIFHILYRNPNRTKSNRYIVEYYTTYPNEIYIKQLGTIPISPDVIQHIQQNTTPVCAEIVQVKLKNNADTFMHRIRRRTDKFLLNITHEKILLPLPTDINNIIMEYTGKYRVEKLIDKKKKTKKTKR